MYKNKKQKTINGMFVGAILITTLTITTLGVHTLLTKVETKSAFAGQKTGEFFDNPAQMVIDTSFIPKTPQKPILSLETAYQYNDRIPKDVIIEEMNILGERFGFSAKIMDNWMNTIQEESGFNNLAKNKTSTALGIAQYLIGTWQETESFKQLKIARTDYKASLFEMALDIANGETWCWVCWDYKCN